MPTRIRDRANAIKNRRPRDSLAPNAIIGEWLPWLGRVRFLAITFLVGIVIAARHLTPSPIPVRSFVPLMVLWYTLAIFYVILQRWIPQARWHAPLQIACDLLMVTGVVYATGSQDSYFMSLYLLAILMASMLFSRRGVFVVPGRASALLGGHHRAQLLRSDSPHRGGSSGPEFARIPGWPSIASLFSRWPIWAVCWRRRCAAKAVELEEKSEELKDLQAFNQDIIESMRGGLLTADLKGRFWS